MVVGEDTAVETNGAVDDVALDRIGVAVVVAGDFGDEASAGEIESERV